MKGLILKDLYTLRQMGKIYLICMVCLVIWGLVTDNPTMLSSLLLVYGLMLLITTASYDEASHFNRYALTLPLTPKKLVQGFWAARVCLRCWEQRQRWGTESFWRPHVPSVVSI